MLIVAALAAVAWVAFLVIPGNAASVAGLFAASAILGWTGAASLITYFCGLSGLMIELPDILGDFHALSAFAIRLAVGNGRSRSPALFFTAEIEVATCGRTLVSPPVFVPYLRPGDTALCNWRISARSRGDLELIRVRAAAVFPGSLVSQQGAAMLRRHLMALPAVYRIDVRVLEFLKGSRLASGRLNALPAAAEEFTGVRLYRPGDNPRYIHGALSLRVADYPHQLVVREFEDPSAYEVCVVLDNELEADEQGNWNSLYRREKAISFAVALCRLLCDRKFGVRFRTAAATVDDIVLSLTRPTRDLPQLEAKLAQLGPCRSPAATSAILQQEARRSNAWILLVSLQDNQMERRNPGLPVVTITPAMQVSLTLELVGE